MCCQEPMSCKQQPDPERQKPHSEPHMQNQATAACGPASKPPAGGASAGECNANCSTRCPLRPQLLLLHCVSSHTAAAAYGQLRSARPTSGAVPTCQQKDNSGKSFSGEQHTGCRALPYTKILNQSVDASRTLHTHQGSPCRCAWPQLCPVCMPHHTRTQTAPSETACVPQRMPQQTQARCSDQHPLHPYPLPVPRAHLQVRQQGRNNQSEPAQAEALLGCCCTCCG